MNGYFNNRSSTIKRLSGQGKVLISIYRTFCCKRSARKILKIGTDCFIICFKIGKVKEKQMVLGGFW